MCYALFIGTDRPLPIPSVEEAVEMEHFHLESLQPHHDVVRANFSKPHLFYASSWQGCGCGWYPDTMLFQRRKARDESSRKTAADVRALGALLARILESSDSVELYFSFEGELDEGARRRISLAPADFGVDSLPMQQGDFALVTEATS